VTLACLQDKLSKIFSEKGSILSSCLLTMDSGDPFWERKHYMQNNDEYDRAWKYYTSYKSAPCLYYPDNSKASAFH